MKLTLTDPLSSLYSFFPRPVNIKWSHPFDRCDNQTLGPLQKYKRKWRFLWWNLTLRCPSHSNIILKSNMRKTEPNMDPQVLFYLPSILGFSPQVITLLYHIHFFSPFYFTHNNWKGCGSGLRESLYPLFLTNTIHFIWCPLQGWSFLKPFFVFFNQSIDGCYGLKDGWCALGLEPLNVRIEKKMEQRLWSTSLITLLSGSPTTSSIWLFIKLGTHRSVKRITTFWFVLLFCFEVLVYTCACVCGFRTAVPMILFSVSARSDYSEKSCDTLTWLEQNMPSFFVFLIWPLTQIYAFMLLWFI